MITLLTCTDSDKLSAYPLNTRLFDYSVDEKSAGHIAIIPYKSSMEILSLSLSGDEEYVLKKTHELSTQEISALDTMIRAVGAVALDSGIFSLCCRQKTLFDILVSYGFSIRSDFAVMYLSELFKPCASCKDNDKKLE